MRLPITRLLKLADDIEAGHIFFEQQDFESCVIGLANRRIAGKADFFQNETEVFAEAFGIDNNTVNNIYTGSWREVLGNNYRNDMTDNATVLDAVKFIREFVAVVEFARHNSRKVRRSNAIKVKNGRVSA